MEIITQREFRNNSAAIMDAVESGQTYLITRNGVEVAELRPRPRRIRMTAEELVARHQKLSRVDHNLLRSDTDVFFGSEDRIGDSDPDERSNG